MQRGSSRWLAPAGVCALVSGLCLLILWVQGPSGQPLLFTGPHSGYGGRWATCSAKNPQLGDFMRQAARRGHHDPLLPQSTDFNSFVEEVRASLERHHLGWRPIDYLFSSDLPDGAHLKAVHPSCGGDYMEFGVYEAGSTNKTARWRRRNCHASCPPVFGFDTFSGLPESWTQDDGTVFGEGAFSLGGQFPAVEDNIHLVKGLFSDSIPPFLQLQREMMGQVPGQESPLAYLHIDCDLYAGSKDAFTLLSHKIVPGTIILFDELGNYRNYRDHEIKAFFEWLNVSGAKVATIGMKGPLPNTTYAFDKDISIKEHPQEYQSAAFVVVHKPGSKLKLVW